MLVDSLCNLEKLARIRELESAHPAVRQCPHESWFMYLVQVEILKRLSIGSGGGVYMHIARPGMVY